MARQSIAPIRLVDLERLRMTAAFQKSRETYPDDAIHDLLMTGNPVDVSPIFENNTKKGVN